MLPLFDSYLFLKPLLVGMSPRRLSRSCWSGFTSCPDLDCTWGWLCCYSPSVRGEDVASSDTATPGEGRLRHANSIRIVGKGSRRHFLAPTILRERIGVQGWRNVSKTTRHYRQIRGFRKTGSPKTPSMVVRRESDIYFDHQMNINIHLPITMPYLSTTIE